MGWKSVRDHYRIVHIVKVVDGEIHVGSAYVGDILTIAPDGIVRRRHSIGMSNADLVRYEEEMRADQALLAELVRRPDVFDRSIPVYTWEDGEIVGRSCEETGWPNVTHEGDLMYENRYFADRDEAVLHARADAVAGVVGWRQHVEEAERELARRRALLERAEANAVSLGAEIPFPEDSTT